MAQTNTSGDDFYLCHPRMPVSERAKIFIPFEPLKGYRALLAERERQARAVPRADLSAEQRHALSERLAAMVPGARVRVTYYQDGAYRTLADTVLKLRAHERQLVLASVQVAFEDIASLELEDPEFG